MIFCFNDKSNAARYGFVPTHSPAALPQTDAHWESVFGWKFNPSGDPISRTDAEVREGIQLRGYHVVDFGAERLD
jgi:hypothetical protein